LDQAAARVSGWVQALGQVVVRGLDHQVAVPALGQAVVLVWVQALDLVVVPALVQAAVPVLDQAAVSVWVLAWDQVLVWAVELAGGVVLGRSP